MSSELKLLLALDQIENVRELINGNEHEQYLNSYLIPVKCELNRQLTNLKFKSKLKA
jgi:hypothetical protein